MRTGRPSLYTEELAEEICARRALSETLVSICRDDHMPDTKTVWLWRSEQPDFYRALARAESIGHEALAEECLEISDTPAIGYETRTTVDPGGKVTVTATETDALAHRTLRINTRLRLLAVWSKRYGREKGGGGLDDPMLPDIHEAPQTLIQMAPGSTMNVGGQAPPDLSKLSPDELRVMRRLLLKAQGVELIEDARNGP